MQVLSPQTSADFEPSQIDPGRVDPAQQELHACLLDRERAFTVTFFGCHGHFGT